MADFYAIGTAIATRFSSANVTAPSGETNIRLATCELPDQINALPTVLVYPPEGEFTFNGALRSGVVDFPVRFYLDAIRSNARNTKLLLKWMGALYDQFSGQVYLGLSSYVENSRITRMQIVRASYAGVDYECIELNYQVVIGEATSPTA